MLRMPSLSECDALVASCGKRVIAREGVAGHGAHEVVQAVAVGFFVPLDQTAVLEFVEVGEGFVFIEIPYGCGGVFGEGAGENAQHLEPFGLLCVEKYQLLHAEPKDRADVVLVGPEREVM